MATATAAPKLAPIAAEPQPRGMLLPCPLCGQAEATITLDLAEGSALHCQDCEGDFTTEDVENLIAKWSKMLTWISAMPFAPAAE